MMNLMLTFSYLLFFVTWITITYAFYPVHRFRYSNRFSPPTIGRNHQPLNALGTVALVGSGPGSPDLLTIQALKLLTNATLVISDRLVSKEILDLIKCEIRVAQKHPGCAEKAQQEIYDWVAEAVHNGHNVVRLKIGDPFLFGRGGEEILEFRKLGIEPIVAPGISSSYAAPLMANIPLTHRGVASQVVITTGYGRDGSIIALPAYSPETTVVMLMAVGRLHEISYNMTQSGYPETTPVAIVEKATMPEERVVFGSLSSIAEMAVREGIKAPATIIIGEVVSVLNNSPLPFFSKINAHSTTKISTPSISTYGFNNYNYSTSTILN